MEIEVKRDFKEKHGTFGRLLIDGKFFCYTCEDVVREVPGKPFADCKIPGDTAIPRGRYPVIIDFSRRFQKHLPHILDVPCFLGVRIHSGNKPEDTEGCILLGLTHNPKGVGNSRAAMAKFMPILEQGLAKGKVWLSIS